MFLNHVGIINKSEEQSRGFYQDFLGLKLTKNTVIPSDLSNQLFSIPQEIKMLVFEKNAIKIEVFIVPEYSPPVPHLTHIGFLLENFTEVMENAQQSGVEIIVGKHKDKTVYFVKDFSGNLIEIKQKK
jgi:catechol 2,3-dioxygenase-like lactoylglutathione lyase family enzyme